MARNVKVTVVDDITGEPDASEVTFSLLGTHYSIDLAEPKLKALEDFLAEYVEHGTRIVANRKPVPSRGSARPKVDREQNNAIRDWARKTGHQVSDRGRLSTEVLSAFQAAHAGNGQLASVSG
jgi:nucleoid-associated protein Lsr2